MQVSRNETLIRKKSKLGTYFTLAGLGVLVAGMVASFTPQYLPISMVALIVGFVLSQYGNYNIRRWGRAPRADQMIEQALKGFDDRYHLYSWTLPASQVMLTPQGVYCFTTRDQAGQITVDGSRWRSKMTLGRALLIFAQEGLGNPTKDAFDEADRLEKWVKSVLPEIEPKIQAVVLFVNERAQLQVNESPVPVLSISTLKKWLRGSGKGETLKGSDYRALEQLFNSAAERIQNGLKK